MMHRGKRRTRFGPFRAKLRSVEGQMTVELMAVIPALIVVAAIAVNALLFFSECAAFDRVARNAIRIQAACPAYRQSARESCDLIRSTVDGALGVSEKEFLEVDVTASGGAGAKTTYKATLFFSPTLFGMGLKPSIFGVEMPRIEHSTELAVEAYRPGMLF